LLTVRAFSNLPTHPIHDLRQERPPGGVNTFQGVFFDGFFGNWRLKFDVNHVLTAKMTKTPKKIRVFSINPPLGVCDLAIIKDSTCFEDHSSGHCSGGSGAMSTLGE